MPILVSCSCGKQFRVKNDRAGQKGRCPECGQKVVVPLPVLEADDEAPPVPWVTFSEEWAGEPPAPAEGPRAIDLGIDLGPAAILPPTPPPRADDDPETGRDDPPAVEPEPAPIPRPAAPAPPVAAAVAPPARPQPQRVVLVGIKVPFEDLFDLALKASIAMLCVGFLIGIVLAVAGVFLAAIWNAGR